MLTALPFTALRITADVMKWVYSAGTEKPKPVPVVEQMKPKTGFFSSLFGISGNTPQRGPSPMPQPIVDETEYLKVDQSSVVLAIFTGTVDVKLNQKISTELHRSTKKNPPRVLKYELIYVGRPFKRQSEEKLMRLPDRKGRIRCEQERG